MKISFAFIFLLAMLNASSGQVNNCNFFCNSDFEDLQLVAPGNYTITSQSDLPCWQTTASDQMVEIWGDGFLGVEAFSGNQYVELNANEFSTLYQDFQAVPGSSVTISFAHHGRDGTDIMGFSIGPVGGPYENIDTVSADQTAWVYHTYNYSFPDNAVTNYSIRFISISTATGGGAGNLLDAISATTPEISIQANIQSAICTSNSGSINIQVDGGFPPYQYSWSNGASNTSTISNLIPGNYDVSIEDSFGCTYADTFSISSIEENQLTNVSIVLCENEVYAFNDIIIDTPGQYSDTLLSSSGCDSIIQIDVFIQVCQITECVYEFPSVFTPNGDGLNDAFSTLTNTCSPVNYMIQIFNRWGEQVFESDNPFSPWNGKFNQEDCPDGVYYYIVSHDFYYRDDQFLKEGHFQLLR